MHRLLRRHAYQQRLRAGHEAKLPFPAYRYVICYTIPQLYDRNYIPVGAHRLIHPVRSTYMKRRFAQEVAGMTDQASLFGSDSSLSPQNNTPAPTGTGEPLAARMRPSALDEIVGQEHLLAPGKVLRRSIEADSISSMILWGPPGSGKTTLA